MTDLTPVRERSPRSPIMPIRKALDRAQEFYSQNKRHPVRSESAYSSWGYAPKSSGARQTLATLLMYGILQDSGSGADRKVQLTETAWRYLADEREPQKAEALRAMVLTPKIMSDLWNAWGDDPPGDAECRAQLQFDRGFIEDTARDVLAIYKDNVAFAGLGKANSAEESWEEAKTDNGEPGPGLQPASVPRAASSAASATSSLGRQASIGAGERELVTGLLSKEASFRLVVSGTVGVKEIDRLIRKLELDKEILADAEDDNDMGF